MQDLAILILGDYRDIKTSYSPRPDLVKEWVNQEENTPSRELVEHIAELTGLDEDSITTSLTRQVEAPEYIEGWEVKTLLLGDLLPGIGEVDGAFTINVEYYAQWD